MNWTSLDSLAVPIFLAILGFLFIYILDRTIGHIVFRPILSEREKELRRRLDSMSTTISVLSQQLNEKSDLERELRTLTQAQTSEIMGLRERVREMEKELRDLKQGLSLASSTLVVLGIWPQPAEGMPELDQRGEASALYNAGFEFVELSGSSANIDGVVREMDRVNPDILEIGCHDNGRGDPVLSDGPTEPGWWGELVEGREILLAVLLYCRSHQQDRLNVSDVLLRAGVQSVVSFNRPIPDEQALKFVRLLYEKLGEGRPIRQAVNRAKLVVNRTTRDSIRLRTREES